MQVKVRGFCGAYRVVSGPNEKGYAVVRRVGEPEVFRIVKGKTVLLGYKVVPASRLRFL